jgi:integrase
MARTIRPAAMLTRTARARLRRGRQPAYNALTARAHLGYVRRPAEPFGRWILRRRIGGRYTTLTIGAADDVLAADGVSVFSYDEARERALELAGAERVAGSITVGRVFDDYVTNLRERDKSIEVARTASIYLGELADVPVGELTTAQLQAWLATVAAVPARASRVVPKPSNADDDGEAKRRRQNSANRIAGVIIAALRLARRRNQVPSDAAWRDLRRFEGVDGARARFLTIVESVRLLNACPEDFRRLVRAALETGCRFSELARLRVGDFAPDIGRLAVWKSKTGKPRHVVLTDEGVTFFEQICTGRSGDELMLLRDDGSPWKYSNVSWPMAAAVARATIAPRITFHGLRHTCASLAIMGGVSLMVVAKNLGHTTTRMVERHYGHLAESYITAEIRRGAARFGLAASNVEPLRPAKGIRKIYNN